MSRHTDGVARPHLPVSAGYAHSATVESCIGLHVSDVREHDNGTVC